MSSLINLFPVQDIPIEGDINIIATYVSPLSNRIAQGLEVGPVGVACQSQLVKWRNSTGGTHCSLRKQLVHDENSQI